MRLIVKVVIAIAVVGAVCWAIGTIGGGNASGVPVPFIPTGDGWTDGQNAVVVYWDALERPSRQELCEGWFSGDQDAAMEPISAYLDGLSGNTYAVASADQITQDTVYVGLDVDTQILTEAEQPTEAEIEEILEVGCRWVP